MSDGHAALALIAISFGACASTPKALVTPTPSTQLDEREIELGGLYFELKRGPNGVAIESTDALSLLAEGNRALDAEKTEKALASYQRLLELFPRSPLAPAARFNSGLAHELRGDGARATRAYSDAAASGGRVAIDAFLRIAAVETEASKGAAALAALDRAVAIGGLDDSDRLEIGVRRGAALAVTGELAKARKQLHTAYTTATSPLSATARHVAFFAAMAAFYRGAVEAAALEALELRAVGDLETANALREAAVDRFTEAIDPERIGWTTRAVYAAAEVHMTLASKIEAVPPDPAADADAYRAQIRELTRPLRERAVELHRKNLDYAAAAGGETTWSEGSAARVREISPHI